ncbi:cysteine synthase A [Thermovibrio ammonificans]|jgi:cysteine synthase A
MKTWLSGILDAVGNTPLLRVELGGVEVFLKLESFNPGGSIKDRVAKAIIEEGERSGELTPDKTVIEATSGNTGIGLAMVCAAKGYRCLIVMPENMSQERKKILRAYGAELLLTPAEEGVAGAVRRAQELVEREPERFFPARQFENPVNPKVHYEQTALEVLTQLGRLPALFVAGIGTGGTFTGMARRFKEVNPNCLCVAVEPDTCAPLSGGPVGPHRIQGIGAGFVPKTLDRGLVDRVETVSYKEAREFTRRLAKEFGVLCGVSTGANLAVAVRVAKDVKPNGPVVTVAPDTGERYLSTDLFE